MKGCLPRIRSCAALLAACVSLPLAASRAFPDPNQRSLSPPTAAWIDSLPRPATGTASPLLEGPIDPKTYTLGPGDELEIGLWKEMDRREIVRITPEGFALTRPIGPIFLAGLTLEEGERRIRDALAPYYREGDVTVSLHAVRSFVVHVVGNVRKPGSEEVSAVDRASTAIEEAGGLLETSSKRNIRLVHKNGTEEVVDLTAYENAGNLSKNPFMQDGDVIEVPTILKRVLIDGAVGRPGSYEFVHGEKLAELAPLFGGPLENVDKSRVEVQRFDEEEPSRSIEIELTFEEAFDSSEGGFMLKGGDRIFFRGLRNWHRDATVELQGEFVKPGRYVIDEGRDRVMDVVRRAGGVTAHAAPEEAKLLRPLFEKGGPGIDKEVQFLVGQQTDRLTPEDYEFLKTYYREDYSRLVIDLESLFIQEDSTQNYVLRDGDLLILPTQVDMVRVSGRVVSPGLVAFSPGESFNFYVREAGGYDRVADKGKVRIIKKRSGARLKPSSEIRIEPGDMIWIPPREERDWWQVTRETFTLAAQVATIYLVIQNAK